MQQQWTIILHNTRVYTHSNSSKAHTRIWIPRQIKPDKVSLKIQWSDITAHILQILMRLIHLQNHRKIWIIITIRTRLYLAEKFIINPKILTLLQLVRINQETISNRATQETQL